MGKSRFVSDQIVTFIKGHESHGLECRVIRSEADRVLLSIPGYNGWYPYPPDVLIPWIEYLKDQTGRFYRFESGVLMDAFTKYLEASEIRYEIKNGRLANYVFVWDADEYRATEIRRGLTLEWDGE